MKTINYTDARNKLAGLLDSVEDDREEVIITRAGHAPVVMLSLDDYQSMRETLYLMRSPANARRLLASLDELNSGGGQVRELIEPGDDR